MLGVFKVGELKLGSMVLKGEVHISCGSFSLQGIYVRKKFVTLDAKIYIKIHVYFCLLQGKLMHCYDIVT